MTTLQLRLHGEGARSAAAHVLAHIVQGTSQGVTVQQALDAALHSEPRLSPADAALCTELVYGTLRAIIRIDWLLGRRLHKPQKVPLLVRMALRVAAYEAMHLRGSPAHAVNWAVQAVKKPFGQGLANLVNACLRALLRESALYTEDGWYAAQLPDPYEQLSVAHSIPLWVAKLWIDAYGAEKATAFARAAGMTPWPGVRLNAMRADWGKVRAALFTQNCKAVAATGILFPPGNVPAEAVELARQGALSWQGAGPQQVLEALGARQWEGPVWDACAGRGGKTCAMLEMGLDVQVASDPYGPRLRGLGEELERLRLPVRPTLLQGGAESIIHPVPPRTILLDVPCSGLGTMSRRPDVRLHRMEEQLPSFIETQARIVDAAWAQLARGGHLAYVTCTLNPAENEGQIARLLNLRTDAQRETEWTSTPDAHGADMMYGALIRKI